MDDAWVIAFCDSVGLAYDLPLRARYARKLGIEGEDLTRREEVVEVGILGKESDVAPEGGPGKRGYQVQKDLFEAGLHIKMTGDSGIVAPPLIAEKAHLDQICDILRKVLSKY